MRFERQVFSITTRRSFDQGTGTRARKGKARFRAFFSAANRGGAAGILLSGPARSVAGLIRIKASPDPEAYKHYNSRDIRTGEVQAMFKTIIVATDGSDHADKAVVIAADLAVKYDATITLLHVLLRGNAQAGDLRRLVDIEKLPSDLHDEFERFAKIQEQKDAGNPAAAAYVTIPFSHEVIAGIGNAIVDRAEGIAREHGASSIDRVVTEGDAADIILNCAKDRKADLIVMGTRGLSDLRGLFVGSVSHKVSHLAECTCILVR